MWLMGKWKVTNIFQTADRKAKAIEIGGNLRLCSVQGHFVVIQCIRENMVAKPYSYSYGSITMEVFMLFHVKKKIIFMTHWKFTIINGKN